MKIYPITGTPIPGTLAPFRDARGATGVTCRAIINGPNGPSEKTLTYYAHDLPLTLDPRILQAALALAEVLEEAVEQSLAGRPGLAEAEKDEVKP